MRTKIILVIALMFATFISCQKEFDPTGEWQESYAAYCLLNLKDSVQYIRINRVFLTSGDPAQYFQTPDSVNVDPENMEVTMVALKDGIPEGEPVYFTPTDAFPKEEGLFACEDYYVFMARVLLEADRTYRMVIRNPETGFEMVAETELLGRRPLTYSFLETRYYNINQYYLEPIDYEGPLISSQFEKRIIRFLYYEYHGDEKQLKYVDWRSPYHKVNSLASGDTGQLAVDYLQYLADNIPADPGVKRIAVGVDKMLIINDELVTLFISYTNYSSSGEYIPELTNWDKGTGIFASRYYYVFFAMKLKPETLDTLAYGRFTRALGFADANGNWPPK